MLTFRMRIECCGSIYIQYLINFRQFCDAIIFIFLSRMHSIKIDWMRLFIREQDILII